MAQRFSKPFYNSKAWKGVRELAMIRDKGLCQAEGCSNPAEEVHHIIHLTPNNINDANISLNLDNLTCLCRDCHFKQHKGERSSGRKKDTLRTVRFDTEGNIIEEES